MGRETRMGGNHGSPAFFAHSRVVVFFFTWPYGCFFLPHLPTMLSAYIKYKNEKEKKNVKTQHCPMAMCRNKSSGEASGRGDSPGSENHVTLWSSE